MSNDSLRLIFAGTPDFAASSLNALIASRHEIALVLTQPDRPQGRGRKLAPSPVKACADASNLPVQQPERLDPTTIEKIAALNADLMIVVAYGLILPRSALEACRMGAINVHASLLPRWRGAAPIQRAIQAGDEQTGITIMRMDEGLDTGNMLAKSATKLRADDTGGSLHDRLAGMGSELLLQTLDQISGASEMPTGEAQNAELATYAHKLSKAEAAIDWSQSAPQIERTIRAFDPWPVAFSELGGTRVRLLSASVSQTNTQANTRKPGTLEVSSHAELFVDCGEARLKIERLQFPGGKPVDARQALNGHGDALRTGAILGPEPTSIDA